MSQDTQAPMVLDYAGSRSGSLGFIVFVTSVTALGGFLFGYDTAVINGANQYLKAHFGLSDIQEGLAGSSAIAGCAFGAIFAGFLSDRFGRKKVLLLCAVLYAVSGVLSAVPRTFLEFLAARFISGLGIGASSMVCPVYIAELAPAGKRGRLGALFQLGIVLGIFLSLFVNALIRGMGDEAWNTALGWRWMLGAEVAPAVALLLLLCRAPESPRWLIQAGRESQAREILSAAGGPENAQREIAAVHGALEQEEGGFFELFHARFRAPLIIAVVLMVVSQFCGINAIMYYSTKIFMSAGVGVKDAFAASAFIGLVNVVFTLVAIALVDKAGRRPLLLAGTFVQVLALAATGWIFHARPEQGGVALLATILLFISAFSMALGPISWLLSSEIFPTRVRGRAMSLAAASVWVSCWVVTQTFPMLNDRPSIGPAKTFWVYGVFSLLGFIFVLARIPETKGKTLEEIEASWRGQRGGFPVAERD